MDGSFLSNEQIIEASRNFVCIRCATYEDAEEAEFLRKIFTRNDSLENTVFCMLSPDGEKKLIRASRGPHMFRRPRDMAEKMDSIASDYGSDAEDAESLVAIPKMKDVRLGLNVAACDRLPTVVIVGQSDEQVAELETKLSPVAWDAELQGMFIYFSVTDAEQAQAIEGLDGNPGFAIVQPDQYGLKGKVLAQFGADTSAEDLKAGIVEFVDSHERPVIDYQNHVRQGSREGATWETEIPVEDKGSLRAMERSKQRERGRKR